MAITAAAIALSEIVLFGFIGGVVNWLSGADRATFLATEGWKLALMGGFVLLAIPLMQLLGAQVIHQTLLGNFPQRIRWMSHRYLIRQSMSYFQDEFAGRIAAKLMQTSLAVREVVMKILDMVVYVGFYFSRRGCSRRHERLAAGAAVSGLACRLRSAAALLRSAPRQNLRGSGRRTFA